MCTAQSDFQPSSTPFVSDRFAVPLALLFASSRVCSAIRRFCLTSSQRRINYALYSAYLVHLMLSSLIIDSLFFAEHCFAIRLPGSVAGIGTA